MGLRVNLINNSFQLKRETIKWLTITIKPKKISKKDLSEPFIYTSNKVPISLHLCYYLSCYCFQYSAASRVVSFLRYKSIQASNLFSFHSHAQVCHNKIQVSQGKSSNQSCPGAIAKFTSYSVSWKWMNEKINDLMKLYQFGNFT